MAEVLEIQIQDKGVAGGEGPPRVAPPLGPAHGGMTQRGNVGPASVMPSMHKKEHEGGIGERAGEFLHSVGFGEMLEDVKRIAHVFKTAKDLIQPANAGETSEERFPLVRSPIRDMLQKPPPSPTREALQKPPALSRTPVQTMPTAVPKTPPAPSPASQAPAQPSIMEQAAPARLSTFGEAGASAAEGAEGAEVAGGLIAGMGELTAATGGVALVFATAAAGVFASYEALKLGFHLATDEVRLFGLKIGSAAEDLAKFSPALATANAMNDVRSMMDDLQEANTIGDDLARLAEAQGEAQREMREIWLPVKKEIIGTVVEILEAIQEFLPAIKVGVESLLAIVQAVLPIITAGLLNKAVLRAIITAALGDHEAKKRNEDASKDVLWLDQLNANTASAELLAGERSRLDGLSPNPAPNFPIMGGMGP